MTYKTKDIYLASVILALGGKLDHTDKTDPRHQEFHFSPVGEDIFVDNSSPLTISHSLDFEQIETDYANADLMINAVKFKEALQRMKSVIHST